MRDGRGKVPVRVILASSPGSVWKPGIEELTLDDLGGEGLAIEWHERLLMPGPQAVNGSSHQSLAGSWFAHEEHGRGTGSRKANLLEETSMCRARADQGLASECLINPLPQLHEAHVQLVSLQIGYAGRCARSRAPGRAFRSACHCGRETARTQPFARAARHWRGG